MVVPPTDEVRALRRLIALHPARQFIEAHLAVALARRRRPAIAAIPEEVVPVAGAVAFRREADRLAAEAVAHPPAIHGHADLQTKASLLRYFSFGNERGLLIYPELKSDLLITTAAAALLMDSVQALPHGHGSVFHRGNNLFRVARVHSGVDLFGPDA